MLMIDRWLAGKRNFTAGLLLYDHYGTNTALKNVLAKGETDYSRKLLTEALTEINQAPPKPKVEDKALRVLEVMPKGNDTMLEALQEKWKPKYQLMKLKQHQMFAFGDDNSLETMAKCRELAEEILSIEQEVMQIWAERDYYEAHGRLPNNPTKKVQIPTDPVQLAKFIDTCKRQMRRYRYSSATNPDHAQILADNKLKYKQATGKDYEFKD